jgi:hypothetical protein
LGTEGLSTCSNLPVSKAVDIVALLVNSFQMLSEIVRPGPYFLLVGAATEWAFEAAYVKAAGSFTMPACDMTLKIVGSGKTFQTVAFIDVTFERFGVSIPVFSVSML